MYLIASSEILCEIQRLRLQQDQQARSVLDPSIQRNPALVAELRQLRQRRDELESRMAALQGSRKELMLQLETLMKLLKARLNFFFEWKSIK